MDDSIAAKHEPVAVVIRFNTADLYPLVLRQYFKFPTVLGFLIPVGLVASFENKAGQGFYMSKGLLLLFFGLLPGVQIFRMRNSP